MSVIHLPFRLIFAVSMLFLFNFVSSQQVPAGKEKSTNILYFKNFTYVDEQGTGLEAFSFLMPSDWKFEGGMNWILDNPMMPSVSAFRVYNPRGKRNLRYSQITVFPGPQIPSN